MDRNNDLRTSIPVWFETWSPFDHPHSQNPSFLSCCKRTIQYLDKLIVLDMTACTAFRQVNMMRLQQMIQYSGKTPITSRRRSEEWKQQKKNYQHPVILMTQKCNLNRIIWNWDWRKQLATRIPTLTFVLWAPSEYLSTTSVLLCIPINEFDAVLWEPRRPCYICDSLFQRWHIMH